MTQKVVRDTLSSQDIHLIWNSFLKEYRSYALDLMPILETRSEVKVTVTKNGTRQSVIPRCIHTPNCHQRCIYTYQIWNFYLKEYKRCAPDTIILKTRSEVKVKVTVTRKWYVTLRHPRMHLHTKFGILTSKNIAPDSKQFLETRSENKVNVTGTQGWCATLCHLKMHPNTNLHPNTKFGIPSLNNIRDMLPTRLF